MIIDTHSHCYWDSIEPRIDAIVENMQQAQVSHAIQIGCDIKTSEQAIDLARRFPGIFYATVGFHPETAQDMKFEGEVIEKFERLLLENRDVIVAIGETGFDYHYLTPEIESVQKKNQEQWWLIQWELAQKYDLPLVIHTRDARNETIEFMIEHDIYRAVIHCYSEDPEFAQKLMDFSSEIYFAFGGILTYKKSELVQETAKMLPLNRILLETDAPFLSPQVVRGTINEPAYTRHIFDRLCELRSEDPGEIEETIYQNSLKFYGIK
ncbi:TatD family hydrolase [Candidatus Gracilibacteria bacterium]|nr:TatD family hydrolase [Candidatus Gracilibacteria bacterium]